jgi:hypothetical protein
MAATAIAERIRAAVEAAEVPHEGHPDSPVLTLTLVVGKISARTTVSAVIEREAALAFTFKVAGVRNSVFTLDHEDPPVRPSWLGGTRGSRSQPAVQRDRFLLDSRFGTAASRDRLAGVATMG